MLSTMSCYPLTIGSIFEHGVRVHGDSEVATWTENGLKRIDLRSLGGRVRQLARALQRLGLQRGDRVGTLCWNTQEHIEAYYAISAMGGVVHTLNLRLFPDQLAYIVHHGGDRILLVDACLVPLLDTIRGDLRSVETVIVVGEAEGLPEEFLRYEDLLAGEASEFEWPDLDERCGAVMCYTTGTTGDPKGVVYSHRSIYLHALSACAPWGMGVCERDRVVMIVPMFHANGWGLPYAAWFSGSNLLMPGRFMQPESLCRMIREYGATIVCGVPTILSAMFRFAVANAVDLSLLRLVFSGGAALPRSLADGFRDKFGVKVIQGWGLTETSPVLAVAQPPAGCAPDEEIEWATKTGRIIPGVELRVCDGDRVLPWDGESVGEFEVRGPWITASYYDMDAPEKFHDGWLRTGDVGVADERGFLRITDRSKDVIKSGGEWISSVELENAIIDHPDVLEAAVIGVPDERWDERPLACVVPVSGATVDIAALRAHLAARVAKWWIPERWAFLREVPKTSVGKFDKKVLRAMRANGQLEEILFGGQLAGKEVITESLVP